MEAGLLASIDLVAHVHLRSRVFADQDDSEAGAHALSRKFFRTLFESGAQLLAERVSVE